MILLFSEHRSDYAHYLYPYVIWGVPEPGERPRDFYARGFLPGSPALDRYYLCRNLRVDLGRFRPSSENRRILRRGEGWVATLTPRDQFRFDPARQRAWKAFADARFGEEVMGYARLDRLMQGRMITHLLEFHEASTGREVGTALLCLDPPIAHYCYAFYDLALFQRSLGLFMMTAAVEHFARDGFTYLHLGTCYSERALYKTQFAGLEFFNGAGWSTHLAELKFLVRRERQPVTGHLFEHPDFFAVHHPGGLPALAAHSPFRLDSPTPPRAGEG